jgi:predicted nucleic acid-binding protein
MQKYVLDASVALEILLNRKLSNKCLEVLNSKDIDIYISILTIHLIYYFGLKMRVDISEIHKFSQNMKVLDSSHRDYDLAVHLCQGQDFEDALQVATAINNKADKFLTLDKQLYRKYRELLEIELVE